MNARVDDLQLSQLPTIVAAGLPTPSTMLDRALALLERGFNVFPLGGYQETPPTYFIQNRFDGDVAKATEAWPKQPRISWKAFQSAPPSEDQVRHWWTQYPNANIGIAAGEWIGVDADSDTAAEWCKNNLPHTPWRVKTASGKHFYYRKNPDCEIRNSADPHAKLDTRGMGGYLVAEGSRHASGTYYTAEHDPDTDPNTLLVSDLPMLDATHMAAILAYRNANNAGNVSPVPTGQGNLSGITPIFDNKATGAPVLSGGRNNAAASLAGQYLAQGLSLRDAKSLLDSWNQTNPQPLSDSELNTTLASVTRTHQANHPEQPVLAEALTAEKGKRGKVALRFPKHLFRPPGLVGDLADYITRTAHKPQPVLALGAALALAGTIMGRKVCSSSDLRTNIYVLAVADSASGKEYPRQACKKLLDAAGGVHLIGAEDLASDAGLFATIISAPSCLLLIDEIGRFLKAINSQHAPQHLTAISTLLIRLTAAANGPLPDKKRAEHARGAAAVVQHPNVCLYGTTVPTRLIQALRRDDIADGFIGRLLCFHSDDPDPDVQDVTNRAFPDGMVELVNKWIKRPVNAHPRGDLDLAVNPLKVQMTSEAQLVLDAFEASNRVRKAKVRGTGIDALWGRAREHAIKMALIVACGCDFDHPIIERDHVEWACELVTFLTDRLIVELDDNLADSEHEVMLKKILKFIGQKGEVSRRDVQRKFGVIKGKELDDILKSLQDMGHISLSTKSAKSGGPASFWVQYIGDGDE